VARRERVEFFFHHRVLGGGVVLFRNGIGPDCSSPDITKVSLFSYLDGRGVELYPRKNW